MRRRGRGRAAPARWSGDPGRGRVLVEEPCGASQWAMTRILERAGYQVETCGGPTRQRCPLLEGERCLLAEGADLIWNRFDLRGPDRRVVEQLVSTCPATPIVVEIPEPERRDRGSMLDEPSVTAVAFPVLPGGVVPVVERRLGLTTEAA